MLIEAFVRRVNLTGLSAAAKSLRTRMFRRRIYFAHIPKSGGTSLSHMMRARYPVSYFKLDEDASREACPGAASGADEIRIPFAAKPPFHDRNPLPCFGQVGQKLAGGLVAYQGAGRDG